MLTYNTRLEKLEMPEYGRNIQRMVDHCRTLPEKEERTLCAESIIAAMNKIMPCVGDPEEHRRKLWDHLAMMSKFDLDIDWPYEVIQAEELNVPPQPIPLPCNYVNFRQYGKNVEIMLMEAAMMEPGEEKDVLVVRIANHMKKLMVTANNDGIDDEKIFNDILHMTHGQINLFDQNIKLHEYKALPTPQSKKKKKK